MNTLLLCGYALACRVMAVQVVWNEPTKEPTWGNGARMIGGGMPIGNGNTVASVFPLAAGTPYFLGKNTSFVLPRGVSFFVNMATAMASDTSLFRLGMVSLQTVPDMFSGALNKFQQTLNSSDASVTIATDIATIKVWVDAESESIRAVCSSTDGTPIQLAVTVQSVHPSTNFTFQGGVMPGGRSTCTPDTLEAEGNVLMITHRNEDSDTPKVFNDTLRQQGLDHLVDSLQGSDRWRHRQFGMRLSGAWLNAVNSSALISDKPRQHFAIVVSTHANQTQTSQEFKTQLATLHATQSRQDSGDAWSAHERWWSTFWNRSRLIVSADNSTLGAELRVLSNKYALTRYIQAIQARDRHWVPIKFNGQQFISELPPETADRGPTFRGWGGNMWWQNTRLPYGNTLASGDYDVYANILEFYLQMLDFSEARTLAYFNHTGIFYTETATLFGAYGATDYAAYGTRYTPASARNSSTLPVWLEKNPYVHFDFGGDGGTTEIAFMVLDFWQYTQDEAKLRRYLPIVTSAIDFFRQHYNIRDHQDRMVFFPTQSLETYWCDWKDPDAVPWPQPNASNCLSNDHPTIVSLHAVLEKALQLPMHLVSPELRRQWMRFQSILPSVPLIEENGVLRVSPYGTFPKGGVPDEDVKNIETPEMYSTHPFRHFTLGRHLLHGVDISPSIQCFSNSSRKTCQQNQLNSGWTQGVMNAALLGMSSVAGRMVLERAKSPTGAGFRFPAFAPGDYDYAPSADHYANMNTALNWMILQPADDGLGSALLFGAWPCTWDVDFKLAAPKSTIVEGRLKDGQLKYLSVTPSHRADFIHVVNCKTIEQSTVYV